MPPIFIIQALAGAMRGVGDTKSPMVISGIQILLHMALNFLLIFPPRHLGGITLPGANLGLVGASLALTISSVVSAVGYLAYSSRTQIGNCLKFSAPEWPWVSRILKVASPASAMAILRVASLAAFTNVLTHVPGGSEAIGGMGIAFSLESIMFMLPMGISFAAAALVGQSLGAKDPQRAERLGWLAAHGGGLLVAAICIPLYFFAPHIIALLVASPEIGQQSLSLIRALCLTEILFAYSIVTIGSMQGAGDTVRPMIIAFVCMWLLRVPFAYVFAVPFALGAKGAWIAMSGSQAVHGVMSLIAFRQGRWKTVRV